MVVMSSFQLEQHMPTDANVDQQIIKRLDKLELGQSSLKEKMGVLEKGQEHIESRINATEVNNAVFKVHIENILMEVGSIKGMLKWILQIIIGSIVLAAMGFALSGGFSGVS